MKNLHKLSALFVFALGFGCAGAAQQADNKVADKVKDPSALGPTRQRVVNISAVDLTGCFPKAPELPVKLNAQALTGLLIASRPVVMECLVDPKNRDKSDETQFTLETTVDAGKLTHKFDGTNLTDAGKQCIGAAVEKFVATAPDWATKSGAAKAITAKAPFEHSVVNMPAVRFGVSEASDVTGTIRLAQGGFCDCYAGWKDADPTPLNASIKVKKDAGATFTFDASQDAAATQVAACLQPKVTALPLKTTAGELTLSYTFIFINAMRDSQFASATPELAFEQSQAVRNQYFAASIIADGGRVVASEADGVAVAAYQKLAAELPAVQATCADIMKAHDNYRGALEKELALEEKALATVTEFAAKDPSWEPTKNVVTLQVEGTKKDLVAAQGVRGQDEAMCAKRYPAAAKPKK